MATPYRFIGGPADGRTIDLVGVRGSVRFFSWAVVDTTNQEVATSAADEVREGLYLLTGNDPGEKPSFFYRLATLTPWQGRSLLRSLLENERSAL